MFGDESAYIARYGATVRYPVNLLLAVAFIAGGIWLGGAAGAIGALIGGALAVSTVAPVALRREAIRIDGFGISGRGPIFGGVKPLPWARIAAIGLVRQRMYRMVSSPAVQVTYVDQSASLGRPEKMSTLYIRVNLCPIDEDALRHAVEEYAPTEVPVEGTLRR